MKFDITDMDLPRSHTCKAWPWIHALYQLEEDFLMRDMAIAGKTHTLRTFRRVPTR